MAGSLLLTMGYRLQAVFRLLILLPVYLVLIVISPLLFAATVIAFIADILLQLATGGPGLTASGNPLSRLFDLYRRGFNYVVFGE